MERSEGKGRVWRVGREGARPPRILGLEPPLDRLRVPSTWVLSYTLIYTGKNILIISRKRVMNLTIMIGDNYAMTQGRFYVGGGGTGPPNVGQPTPPPKYFGSNSKNTHC